LAVATAEVFVAGGAASPCARATSRFCTAAEQIRKQHNLDVPADALNVTDAGAVSHFVAAVAQKFGGIDICVTNAGGPPAKGFLAATSRNGNAPSN
jgi:3-oxoacyl-[acyl-carrier protein] reductase